MGTTITFDQVIGLAKQLSTLDKIRLIEQIAPQIKQDLQIDQKGPRQSLRGLWQGLDITAADIDQARDEMWRNFPREDI